MEKPYYLYGNIGNAILKEILECFFISLLLVSVFGGVLKVVLSGVGSFLLFILKAALVIAGIVIAMILIAAIIKAISAKKSNGHGPGTPSSQNTAEQTDGESAGIVQLHGDAASEVSDAEISAYIRKNFTSSDYLQAIRYYRERTGADIETAKAMVGSILKSEKANGE